MGSSPTKNVALKSHDGAPFSAIGTPDVQSKDGVAGSRVVQKNGWSASASTATNRPASDGESAVGRTRGVVVEPNAPAPLPQKLKPPRMKNTIAGSCVVIKLYSAGIERKYAIARRGVLEKATDPAPPAPVCMLTELPTIALFCQKQVGVDQENFGSHWRGLFVMPVPLMTKPPLKPPISGISIVKGLASAPNVIRHFNASKWR